MRNEPDKRQPLLDIFQGQILIKHIIDDAGDRYELVSGDCLTFPSRKDVETYLKESIGLSSKTIKKLFANMVVEDQSSLPF